MVYTIKNKLQALPFDLRFVVALVFLLSLNFMAEFFRITLQIANGIGVQSSFVWFMILWSAGLSCLSFFTARGLIHLSVAWRNIALILLSVGILQNLWFSYFILTSNIFSSVDSLAIRWFGFDLLVQSLTTALLASALPIIIYGFGIWALLSARSKATFKSTESNLV